MQNTSQITLFARHFEKMGAMLSFVIYWPFGNEMCASCLDLSSKALVRSLALPVKELFFWTCCCDTPFTTHVPQRWSVSGTLPREQKAAKGNKDVRKVLPAANVNVCSAHCVVSKPIVVAAEQEWMCPSTYNLSMQRLLYV